MADLVASEMNANDIQNVYVKSGVTRGNCTAVQVYFSGNCIEWLVQICTYELMLSFFPCKPICMFHNRVYVHLRLKKVAKAGWALFYKMFQQLKIYHTLLSCFDAMQMKTSFDPTTITGYESVDLVNCGAGKQKLIKCLVRISTQEARLRFGFNSCNVNCFSVDFDIIQKERQVNGWKKIERVNFRSSYLLLKCIEIENL